MDTAAPGRRGGAVTARVSSSAGLCLVPVGVRGDAGGKNGDTYTAAHHKEAIPFLLYLPPRHTHTHTPFGCN